MDFQDSASEAEVRADARAWLAANLPDAEARRSMGYGVADEAAALALAKTWQARKADAGWACMHWPAQYGGRGASPIERLIFEEEERRAGAPTGFFEIGLGMAGPTLQAYASEEQKASLLPRMLRGQDVWCQLFSEPAAGSDLAALRMRAVRDGDDWVLTGQKTWTSGAHYADYGIIVARSDPSLPKHRGLTFFFVDMRSPGITTRQIRQITGPADFDDVFFDEVRVADSQRLGAVGAGWQVALTTLMNERLSLGDVARPGYEELVARLRMSEIGGRPALEQADIAARVTDWHVRSRGVAFTRARIITALSRGQEPGPEASILKLASTAMFQEIADFATGLEDQGGVLLAEDRQAGVADFQFAYLFSPSFRVAGGTDQILRNIIAERVLGLPPEPRVDKDVPFNS
ncbi:MAG: acyl-CoA dehydrogenase domain protein [Caulobacter sp.]|nr:acyl-CoA dehydrogenase domain protein [Caulobacter sp.]